ncbi:MAG: fructose-6-phosphate aldolase [Deltaproteobacteria bacterium]|nr:fructose-6-phosphate aldolase [Deltaproteobacteria bacterium]
MKIFIDTADVDAIREYADIGIVDGVTTNPSLIAKTGRKFEEVVREICDIVDGPISAEAVSLDAPRMIEETRVLAKIHPNVVVKIPMTAEGLKTVKTVSAEGIKTNVTLCFSSPQALFAAKAGATYISPFVGRLDDISVPGMNLIQEIVDIYENYNFETEVLVASIRNPLHFVEAAEMGAHVSTIPPKVLGQLIKHPLTSIGIDQFMADWEKVPR